MTALAFVIRYSREIAIGLLLAAVGTLVLLDAHHAGQRDELRAWQADVRGATSRAAGTVDQNGKPGLLALDQVALQITYLGNGVERLTAALEAKNRESEDRAKAFADSKADFASAQALNAARAAATDERIDAMKGLARDLSADPNCTAPAALLNLMEGL